MQKITSFSNSAPPICPYTAFTLWAKNFLLACVIRNYQDKRVAKKMREDLNFTCGDDVRIYWYLEVTIPKCGIAALSASSFPLQATTQWIHVITLELPIHVNKNFGEPKIWRWHLMWPRRINTLPSVSVREVKKAAEDDKVRERGQSNEHCTCPRNQNISYRAGCCWKGAPGIAPIEQWENIHEREEERVLNSK